MIAKMLYLTLIHIKCVYRDIVILRAGIQLVAAARKHLPIEDNQSALSDHSKIDPCLTLHTDTDNSESHMINGKS